MISDKTFKKLFYVLLALFIMGADWSKPDLNSLKSNFPGEIRAIAESAATMDFSGDTNIPTDAIRYNATKAALERYNGSSWSRLFPVAGGVQMYMGTTAPTGYLLLNGSTIGSASSGATALASADAEDLFTFLWTNLANSEAAVSGGRGGSAAADFAANKTLTLPDMRQKFPLGKAAAGTGSTLGGTGGSIDHNHTLPAHYHGMSTGADLNITSSGSHITALDHDHGAFTSATGDSKSYRVINGTPDGLNHTAAQQPSYMAGGTYGDYTDTSWMGADHTHSINVPNYTANSASSGAHTHAAVDFAGRIGLVTGGVDGNAVMTSGTNNPPFITVNYIIKI